VAFGGVLAVLYVLLWRQKQRDAGRRHGGGAS
jgi:hypothetical protein